MSIEEEFLLEIKNENDIFKLPKVQSEDDYFPEFLEQQLSKYYELIEKIITPHVTRVENFKKLKKSKTILKPVSPKFIADGVKDIVNKINESIKKTFLGLNSESFNLIEEAYKTVHLDSNIYNITFSHLPQHFYRIRKSDKPSLENKDLFHIPFEKRGKTANQRFSISGHPGHEGEI